ncbi:hypothetical protein ABZT02_35980 [Streptomyces sp. NPDC005402]|uniref:hypothetical protein n=1 Tax=unclassified Streptomyces TaxID=2593676 RepID=UPI00131F07D0|nr:hypothetical protein [Streptomyces sp. P3]
MTVPEEGGASHDQQAGFDRNLRLLRLGRSCTGRDREGDCTRLTGALSDIDEALHDAAD